MRRIFALFLMPFVIGAADPALQALQAVDARVLTIAYRLKVASAELCTDRVADMGVKLHQASDYGGASQRRAVATFGLSGETPAVLALAHNGPAMRAGVRVNDQVVQITGTHMRIQRGGRLYDYPINAPLACKVDVYVVPGKKLNARADDATVNITTGLIAFAGNDDAIATALAHEMAHSILNHQAQLDRSGRGRKAVRATEVEADYWGTYLLARAGYDLDRAMDFWVRYESKTNKGLLADGTHPGKKERLSAVARTIAELREKQRLGQRLIPGGK
jgi:beta-barrel assembly-enhancing protease